MTKAVDKAYERIRRRILSGEYAPGMHLKEEHIAEDTGVSRTPVREALRRLGAEQWVRFVSNRGAYVADWSTDDLDDVFRLRIMLEGYAGYRAATRIGDEAIRQLEVCATQLESLDDERGADDARRRMLELTHRFHSLVVEAADSARLSMMLTWLLEIPLVLQRHERVARVDTALCHRHLRDVILALRARDPLAAQRTLEAHLHEARSLYAAGGASPGPGPGHQPARVTMDGIA